MSTVETPPYPATPALDRLAKQSPARDTIGRFLEWLVLQGYHVCVEHTHGDDCYTLRLTKAELIKSFGDLMTEEEKTAGRFRTPQCGEQKFYPAAETFTAMLDRYFTVDVNEVEKERRAVLEHVRRRQ